MLAEQLVRKLPWLSEAPHFLEGMEEKGLIERTEVPLRQVGDATQKMVRLTGTELPQKLTPKQRTVLSVLEENKQVSLKELCYYTGVTAAVVQALERKKLVEFYDREVLFRFPRSRRTRSRSFWQDTGRGNRPLHFFTE